MTPFRVSFAGGGTDIQAFYEAHGGCVVSTTINKYMYLFVHPSFDEKTQVKYSKTELVDEIDQIQHPIVRETLRIFGLKGIDVSSIADIPAGTGLGSSSAFTVGLFNALYTFRRSRCSTEQLARDACHVEIDVLKEPIGRQDQYASAYGGLNMITFAGASDVRVEPILMPAEKLRELEDNILMFYTGSVREAGHILADQARNIGGARQQANLIRMSDLARELRDSLVRGDIDDMGRILDESWNLKKGLSSRITHQTIDDFYELAKKNGALGGKLLGAGGGGFFLVYCRKENQERLRRALPLREMKVLFDFLGSRIILNSE